MTTQYANASYQEIIDLHTESDSVSVIGIHTPISDTPHKMMKGFFEQFKKFRYAGCSVSLVPAARLPADPLQVSYEAGEPTIDPRDMLNPLMFHGCHGNDLGMVLNRLYNLNSGNSLASDSVNLHQGEVIQSDFVESDLILDGQELENLYYKALTDNTWKKAHPQRGFRKSGLHPMIYSLATTQQILNESLLAAPTSPYNIGLTRGVPSPAQFDYDTVSNPAEWSVDVPVNRQFKLMTPRIQRLGWLDTRQVLTTAGSDSGTFDTTGMSESEVREALSEAFTDALNGIVESQEVYATLPKIYMGVILMPPAYKTEQYFRMIITHHFEFKNFRGISFANDIHESPCYDNWNEDISLGSGGDTGGEVDPPNPDDPDDPGEGGGDGETVVFTTELSDPVTFGNFVGYRSFKNTTTGKQFTLAPVNGKESLILPNNQTLPTNGDGVSTGLSLVSVNPVQAFNGTIWRGNGASGGVYAFDGNQNTVATATGNRIYATFSNMTYAIASFEVYASESAVASDLENLFDGATFPDVGVVDDE